MQIEKINYQRTFNLGNYSSERLGVDININTGENAMQALDEARKLVEEWHTKNHPELYQDKTPDVSIIPKNRNEDYEINKMKAVRNSAPVYKEESLEDQINSCKSPTVLKAVYEKLVKNKPELQTVYDNKLKELT